MDMIPIPQPTMAGSANKLGLGRRTLSAKFACVLTRCFLYQSLGVSGQTNQIPPLDIEIMAIWELVRSSHRWKPCKPYKTRKDGAQAPPETALSRISILTP